MTSHLFFKGDFIMKLSQPKNTVFFISVILIVAGLVVKFIMAGENVAPGIQTPGILTSHEIGFWITFVGGGLLVLGNLLKDL